MMKKFALSIVITLIIGGYATAGTSGEDNNIPSTVLYGMTSPIQSKQVPTDSIGKSIYLFKNLKDTKPASVNLFYAPLDQAVNHFMETINASRESFPDKENKIDLIEKGTFLLKGWATSENVTDMAKILRMVYATAKIEEITSIVKKENNNYYFTLNTRRLWKALNIKFSWEVYKKYPNEAIDGFLISIFDHEGRFKAQDTLALIIKNPFALPSKVYFSTDESKHPSLRDYEAIYNHLNGKFLGAWYEGQTAHPSLRNKKAYHKPVFPEYDHKSIIKKIENSTNPNDILLLALLKHTYGTGHEVAEIAEMLDSIKDQLQSEYPVSDFEPEGPYDGTDQSMINFLRHYSENHLGGAPFFTIPCDVLITKPKLLPAISPYYGGNRDNFLPRVSCNPKHYPLPPSVEDYLTRVDVPQGGWLAGYRGTMRYMHHKLSNNQDLMLRVFPRQLLYENEERHHYPYETWSYLNIENRHIYEELRDAYIQACKDLSNHYQSHFLLSEAEAKKAAENGLWLPVREGHWGKPPTSGLRYRIMENHPYEDIEKEINSSDDLADLEQSMLSMDYYSGAWTYVGLPDPLIMTAVKRPKVLKLLIHKKNRSNDEPYDYSRWKSLEYANPNTGVSTRNKIGKTALHAAIQQNEFESTRLLVEAGADLTAVVDGPLVNNKRTVAMYAAANADFELLRYLADKGIDFSTADSKGVGPVGYLMGFGKLKANPHLTNDNFIEYVNLLQPGLFSDGGKAITPAYNCEDAANQVERTICGDTYLSMLDRFLSAHYKKIYANTEDKSVVKKGQIEWIKARNKCPDKNCIEAIYEQRIEKIANDISEANG